MNNALTKTLTAGLMHRVLCKTPLGIMQLTQINMAEKWKYWFGYDHRINSRHFNAEICIRKGLVSKGFNSKQIKPYLFPMSSLTKEIEFKGKRFVPIDFFEVTDDHDTCPIEQDYGNIKLILTLKGIAEYNVSFDVKFLPSWVVDKLRSWHFNVDDLSPEEFIEVNENNNPY